MMYEFYAIRNFKQSTDRIAMSGDAFFREGRRFHVIIMRWDCPPRWISLNLLVFELCCQHRKLAIVFHLSELVMFWFHLGHWLHLFSVWGRHRISWFSHDLFRLKLRFLKVWNIMKWMILKMYVQYNQEVKLDLGNDIGHSWYCTLLSRWES